MKRLPKTSTWILALFIFLGAAAFTLAISQASARAGAQTLPDMPEGYRLSDVPLKVNAEIKQVQTNSAEIRVDLCMDMPSSEPWNPYASLTIGKNVVPNTGVTFLNVKDPQATQGTYRCYRFTFPYDSSIAPENVAALRLEKVWMEVGRGQYTPETLQTIRQRVQEAAPGLQFEIVSEAGKGGGGGYFQILSLPEGMSSQEAETLIDKMTRQEYLLDWQASIPLK
ncbi:MAG: hypothetical protein Fur0035_03910 [Anaerolineales bacterium]